MGKRNRNNILQFFMINSGTTKTNTRCWWHDTDTLQYLEIMVKNQMFEAHRLGLAIHGITFNIQLFLTKEGRNSIPGMQ